MRVVVVGGVAAGMSCATRLRRRDPSADIIVIERGEYVSFANCGLPYLISGEIADPGALLLQTPESLYAAHGIEVRTRTEALSFSPENAELNVAGPEGEYLLGYDHLVLAPGAAATVPPIPGIDSPRVHTVRSVPDATTITNTVREGDRAVVMGAGFIGIETAEALARRGASVLLVELSPHVLPPIDDELVVSVRDAITAEGIEIVEGVGVTAIVDGSERARVSLSNGVDVPADIIVLSAGVRPDTGFAERSGVNCSGGAIVVDEHGRTNIPGVWAAGDAVVSQHAATGAYRPVALAGPANRAGRLVADAIVEQHSARPLPALQSTAIVRIGASTVAMTGANRASLLAAGIAHHSIHTHPTHHASYFPGAEGMSLVVHVSDTTGEILGAQACGGAGVDTRIDILATAMRAGMRAADLLTIDLAYSPPYGSAKDPINMVGMIADNIETGTMALWYAQDLDKVCRTSLIIDTRSAAEYATGHIPEAINIPHTEIRARLSEVTRHAAGRPVRVHCASGYRSYLAHTVLADAGFDSATLSGGMATLRAVLGVGADTFLTTDNEKGHSHD